jgi:hypothetical protein
VNDKLASIYITACSGQNAHPQQSSQQSIFILEKSAQVLVLKGRGFTIFPKLL